ncbi:carbonic anhydrase [Metarhizium robertsii ARSEF 23]|uniref:Carbonic anhydrase n=1 Tax=Metarhizium robertsii (strain ARSEF 23 / ATCC MYA-3075) TaxID=655844 RepID=E9FCF7_METRA|nr:carbonic anhydrase [Metarhizium robertsii ARSEF 23]EFY94585.2 carbonic anhydrase [Metarhizium robertsii ARSEF 23]
MDDSKSEEPKAKGRQIRDFDTLFDLAVRNGLREDKSDVDSHFVYRRLKGQSIKRFPKSLFPWNAYKKRNPGATPQHLDTLKHYTKFLGLTMKGRIKENNPFSRPTTDSLRAEIRRFCSAWNRENVATNNWIPKEVSESMAPYIEGPLADEIGLLRGKRGKIPRKYFTLDSYKKVQSFHWEEDWFDYIHEGTRVDNTNMINGHAYTSARLSEICQATYKDLECVVGYYDGEPDIKLKFTREFCKAKDVDQPEHPFPERMNTPDGLYPPLVAQPIVHWLANIVSSQAFARYHTLDQILAIRPPKNSNYCIIEWADHMLDKPVFPEWNPDGRSEKTRCPNAWGSQSTALAKRAGMTNGLGFHSVRRKALINCNDAGYSLASILKFASQNNTNVLVNKYLGTVCSIDGVATYQGLPPRNDLAEDFLSATMRWNPDLAFRLPSKRTEEIKDSTEYCSMTEEIDILTQRIAANSEGNATVLRAQRTTLYNKRNSLIKNELRKLQLQQKVDYETDKAPYDETDWHKGHFNRIKHMLPPERLRLATTMMAQASPRSQTWIQAIEDLICLRNSDCKVAYQRGLQPVDGFCPISSCRQEISSLPVEKRWNHIYRCYRALYTGLHCFAQFCFMCNEWVTSKFEWLNHCEAHIETNNVPFRYDPVTFRYATACAGYCPVCIWKTDLPADERLKQYTDRSAWRRHISRCILSYMKHQDDQPNLKCPDERCPKAFPARQALWHHLDDVHSIPTISHHDMSKGDTLPFNQENPRRDHIRLIKHSSPPEISSLRISPERQSWTDELINDSSSQFSKRDSCIWDAESICAADTPLSEVYCDVNEIDMKDEEHSLSEADDPPISFGIEREILIDPMLLCEHHTGLAVQPPSTMSSSFGVDGSGHRESEPEVSGNATEHELAHDNQYFVDRLLGKWRHRGKVWFYLRWNDGSYGFEEEVDINEDLRKDFETKAFTGFHEGAHVKRVRERNGKTSYLTGFLGCMEEWELPEQALHPDLVARHKPAKKSKGKSKRGRKKS